ncbi:MAG TPA: MG2 domain-containing protein, partial [Bdellovibrio sp.]|nr:MG2 domain-containing protein [Bdellovibrio sp.]
LKNISDTELISLVSGKAGTAIIDSEYYATTAVFPDLYLYTDRPMYKSGEKVHFRGILRNLQDGVSKTKSDVKNVTVELQKIDGSVVKKSIQAKVSEFGTFTGTLMLEDGEEGVFRVVASVSKQNHSGEFRVKEYVKPLYFVNVITDQETLKAGDTLKGKLKAERYAGGAPVINKATAELYRVRMETPQWADDAGMGETGSEVTYGYENNKGAQGMLPVLVTSLESIDFDEAGNANFEIKVPDKIAGEKNYNYQFILKFTFVDADENIVGTSKTFYDLAADVVVQAQFNKVVVQKANEASLNVRSVSPSGKVLAKIKGEVEYVLENAKGEHSSVGKTNFQTDDHGKSVLKLPEGLNGKSGDLVAKVKLWDAKKNENLTESSVILAGERSGESVVALSEPRILTNEFILTAKGKARMFMLLPSGWGEKGQNKGNLYVTIAGDKIFSRRIIPVNGLSTWIEEEMKPEYGTGIYLIVSYPDSKQGWIERRSHFRIIDLSKGLKISLKPDNAVVPPGGQQSVVIQVKDQDDKPVKAEVSLTVVDRSVLDMQPEIRPALLDFFYPEVKLNLMTFLSSQFQGYGYGEEIAHLFKANFQMAAVKSQSKVLDQQDTAFWKGDVVTDEKGQAKLQFTMPGNQTIWRMTSVAVDNHGRFGEGQKEFKAQSPVSLLLGYPHFIRKSDKAKIRVNLTSVEPTQSVNVKYNLVSEAPEVLKVTRPEPVTVSLKPKQQFSTDFALTPATEGKSTEVVGLLGALQIGGSQLKLRDTIRVQPSVAVVPEYIFPINNKMNIKLAANESVHSAELQMSTGLASAVV